jgi:predicted RNase H-like HicB family nuclease
VSITQKALAAIGDLPENCTWEDVMRAVARGASGGVRWPAAVHFRAPYGEPAATETRTQEEARVGDDFDVIVEQDAEGWLVGSVPALRGCHTQARTMDELLARVREAAELCLEVSEGHPPATGFVGVRRVSVAV